MVVLHLHRPRPLMFETKTFNIQLYKRGVQEIGRLRLVYIKEFSKLGKK